MKVPFNYKTFEMKSNAEKRKQAKIKKKYLLMCLNEHF